MDQAADPNALDTSVEAFIVAARRDRLSRSAPINSQSFGKLPRYADVEYGNLCLRLDGSVTVMFACADAIGRDLADAINGVLMRHDTLAKADAMGRAWPVKDGEMPF